MPAYYGQPAATIATTLGGVVVEVNRTYDSVRRDQSDQFGNGWYLAGRELGLRSGAPREDQREDQAQGPADRGVGSLPERTRDDPVHATTPALVTR